MLAVHTRQMPATTGPGELVPLVYETAPIEDKERLVPTQAVTGVAQQPLNEGSRPARYSVR